MSEELYYIDIIYIKDMLASLIALAKTDKIPSSDVSDLISSMFQTAGIENTSSISYADFQVALLIFRYFC